MIHLFCSDNLHIIHFKYIYYLLNNFTFLKLIITTDEDMYKYIIDNKLLNSNNILICEIDEILLKKVSTINLNNNFYLLNVGNNDISYLDKYNIQILSQYNSNYDKLIYLPYCIKNELIYNFTKIYDIGIINDKKGIFTKFNTNIITQYNINDLSFFKYKILVNINDDFDFLKNQNLYECCIFNKIIIINCNKIYLNKYILNIPYNIIPLFMIFIIKNYNIIHESLFSDLKLENIEKDIFRITNNVLNNIKKKDNFGFIIIRHVNNEKTNNYWINSYKCIRKFYDNKIVIIDDNSDYSFIKYDSNKLNITNCEFIQSEFNKRGEILGYYYFYKNHFFDKAVIIHDSVFINKYIDFDKYDKIKFLWHFKRDWFDQNAELMLLNNLNNNENLKLLYNEYNKVHGCFGIQSVITHSFLNIIVNKYNFLNLLNYIIDRNERMNLERIFALICINECNDLSNNPSIFGDIHEYIKFGYTYDEYLCNKLEHLNIVKVWTGR